MRPVPSTQAPDMLGASLSKLSFGATMLNRDTPAFCLEKTLTKISISMVSTFILPVPGNGIHTTGATVR